MPSLRAMQCLVAVADQGSVTGAAQQLGITQPALSHQLTSLEKEAGVPLLDRQQRGTRLSTAGRDVLPHARACVAAERAFVAHAERAAGLSTGELRLCCAQSVTTGLLPRVLRRWHKQRRGVTINLTEYDSADRVADAVASGDADLGVAPRPSDWTGPAITIGWEEVVVATASDDPLARRRSVPLTALSDRGLVHYNGDHALSRWVDALFAGAGLAVTSAVRTGQTNAAAVLAATGIGPALVPLSAVPPRYTGAIRPLSPRQGRDIVALTTGSSDALAQAFVADLVANGVPRLPRRGQ